MRILRKLKKSEKGQGIVEFALVLPILIALLLGIVEFGWLLNGYVTLNASAREGARLYAVSHPDEDVKIGEDIYSMQVIKVRARDNDNELFFAKLLGIVESDLVAEAAATWGYIMGDIIPLFTVKEGISIH